MKYRNLESFIHEIHDTSAQTHGNKLWEKKDLRTTIFLAPIERSLRESNSHLARLNNPPLMKHSFK